MKSRVAPPASQRAAMTSGRPRRQSFVVPVPARAEVVLRCDGAEVASWPLECAAVDLAVVDELARLQLESRRRGCSIWLRHACPELVALLRLVGLSEVLQVGGKAEELEQ
jgi:hypothetical protein